MVTQLIKEFGDKFKDRKIELCLEDKAVDEFCAKELADDGFIFKKIEVGYDHKIDYELRNVPNLLLTRSEQLKIYAEP
jgi:hypothetical protein